ncbi:hypothetical protein ISS03_01815 [Patescibacteria group bacterium]|nr:hypothetical protein [Patescibacteria group bacterium]
MSDQSNQPQKVEEREDCIQTDPKSWLHYIAKKNNLRQDIAQPGINKAVDSLLTGFIAMLKREFKTLEEIEEWIMFHLAPHPLPTLKQRVYRIDIYRKVLGKENLIDRLADPQAVAEQLCKDNRNAYDKRLNYGRKLTNFDKDWIWLRKRVRKFFETPKYKAYLIDAPKHEI